MDFIISKLKKYKEFLRDAAIAVAIAAAVLVFIKPVIVSGDSMRPNLQDHNYLILSKGFEDGVSEKSGIITREGVIGIVDAVSAHYSYAFSFQNKDISISARLGEEGGTGLLVWDGRSSRGAILKEIPLQYKYHRGDTVYTSGHSLMFPPDIPLGLAGEARVINGATNEIKVHLFQDFTAIRYVTVVHNTAFDEVEEFLQ